MKIGIVGSGPIGANLTRELTAAGHDVSVANSRGPDTLTQLAAETGATPTLVTDAVRGADVVIVAIPFKNVPDLPTGLFETMPESGVLVDTGNYVPKQRDGRIDAIEAGQVESRWAEAHYGRPVVKAFNTMVAPSLAGRGAPKGTPGRVAIPVAGVSADAKSVVMGLVGEIGFDPVDGGGLDESWRQQPGTPVFMADLDADGTRVALSAAQPERQAAWRA